MNDNVYRGCSIVEASFLDLMGFARETAKGIRMRAKKLKVVGFFQFSGFRLSAEQLCEDGNVM